MHAPGPRASGDNRTNWPLLIGRVSLLLLPLTLLLICSIRGGSPSPSLLWLGTLFQLLAWKKNGVSSIFPLVLAHAQE